MTGNVPSVRVIVAEVFVATVMVRRESLLARSDDLLQIARKVERVKIG